MKKIIYLFILITITMLGCSPQGFEADDDGKVLSIAIKEAVYVSSGTPSMQLSLKDNEELQLNIVIMPQNAKNKNVTFSNKHPELMEVTEAGLIKAKAIGTDTLIVSATDGSGVNTRFVVNIIDHIVKATGITVTSVGGNMEVEIGKTFNLKSEITVNPTDVTNNSVTFKSLNTDIATVDVNGVVTAVAVGSTVITVTTADGSEISTDCNLTVVAEPPLFLQYPASDKWMLSCNLGIKEGSFEALLDDKNSTFWAPDILKRPLYDPTCWLDIDLGDAIKFGQLGYRHRSLNYSHLQLHSFKLQGKKNESDVWTDLGIFITEAKEVSKYQLFEVSTPMELRYLRMNLIKGHLRDGKTDWDYEEAGNVSIGDIQIYIYNR